MTELRISSIELGFNSGWNGKTYMCKSVIILSDGSVVDTVFPVATENNHAKFLKKLRKAEDLLNNELHEHEVSDYDGLEEKISNVLRGELSCFLFPVTYAVFSAHAYSFSLPTSKMLGGVFRFFYPEPIFYYGQIEGGKAVFDIHSLLDLSNLSTNFESVLNHEEKVFSPHHAVMGADYVKGSQFFIDIRRNVEPDFVSLVMEKNRSVRFIQNVDDLEALVELAPPFLSRIIENSIVSVTTEHEPDEFLKFCQSFKVKSVLLRVDEHTTLRDAVLFAKRIKKIGIELIVDMMSEVYEGVDLLEFSCGVSSDKIFVKNKFNNVINIFNFYVEKIFE